MYSFGLLSSSFVCVYFTLLCAHLTTLFFFDVKFSLSTFWSLITGIFHGAFRCLAHTVYAVLVYCIWYSFQPIFKSYGWNTLRELLYPFPDSFMHLALAWVCDVSSSALSTRSSSAIFSRRISFPVGYAISLSICAFNVFNFIYTKSDLVQHSQHQSGNMGGNGARIEDQNIYK